MPWLALSCEGFFAAEAVTRQVANFTLRRVKPSSVCVRQCQ